MNQAHEHGRHWAAHGIALAVCLLLSACGSGSIGAQTTSAGPSTAKNAAKLTVARVAAARCMRRQGIEVPDPAPGEQRPGEADASILARYSSSKILAAERACSGALSQAFPVVSHLTPSEREQRLQLGLVFARCMRSRGIAWPDPAAQSDDPASYYRALGSIDLTSPAVKSDATACYRVMLKAATPPPRSSTQ